MKQRHGIESLVMQATIAWRKFIGSRDDERGLCALVGERERRREWRRICRCLVALGNLLSTMMQTEVCDFRLKCDICDVFFIAPGKRGAYDRVFALGLLTT